MSTFLVSLGVAVAVVLVVWIAISDPDQPATIHRPVDRARQARPQPADAGMALDPPGGAEPRTTVATVEPDVASPTTAATRRRRERSRFWNWLRSALGLVVLVTFAGVILAVLVGASLTFAARALRQAVG